MSVFASWVLKYTEKGDRDHWGLTTAGEGMWMIDTDRGRTWLASWQRVMPLDKDSPRSSGRVIFREDSRDWQMERRREERDVRWCCQCQKRQSEEWDDLEESTDALQSYWRRERNSYPKESVARIYMFTTRHSVNVVTLTAEKRYKCAMLMCSGEWYSFVRFRSAGN